jgi:hypothetical protein
VMISRQSSNEALNACLIIINFNPKNWQTSIALSIELLRFRPLVSAKSLSERFHGWEIAVYSPYGMQIVQLLIKRQRKSGIGRRRIRHTRRRTAIFHLHPIQKIILRLRI